MTHGAAEKAARRIVRELVESATDENFENLVDHVSAIIRGEWEWECELFGRAMVIIKGLTLGTTWEIAPPIKREMEKICAAFEEREKERKL